MDVITELQRALGDTFLIQRELGGGAMGRVFLARETALGRDVVIKARAQDGGALAAERFLREIAVAARLRHPNIVPVLSSGQAPGLLYYTMPFINGRSLREVLAAEGRLPVDLAIQYALEVTDALSYAHGQGIIHRDIKPENILIDSGHAVVTDFGLARAVNPAESAALTHQGVAVGTPLYMSPEQISGEHQIDGRSDIFSLACVLYEMLAGSPPFTGETMATILASRFRDSAVKINVLRPEVPAQLAAAVEKALAADPSKRHTSAQVFADALKQTESRRPSWLVPVSIVATSAAAAVAFVTLMKRDTPPVVQAGGPAATVDPRPGATPSPPPVSTPKRVAPRETTAAKPKPRPPVLFTGGTTEDILRFAVDKYKEMQLEDAVANLRQLLSPEFLQPVTATQRTTAYMYMGAAYADMGKPDTARNYFVAVLAYDPFSAPDPTVMTPGARQAYAAARRTAFFARAEALREHVLKSGEDIIPYQFRIAVTQASTVTVEVVSESDSTFSEVLFQGPAQAVHDIRWRGLLAGRTPVIGGYEIRLTATPLSGRTVTERYPFRIEQRQDRRPGLSELIMIPTR